MPVTQSQSPTLVSPVTATPSPTPTPATSETERRRRKERSMLVILARRCLLVLIVLLGLAVSLVVAIFAFVGGSSIATPGLLHSRCKIVSSSVDIRSTKVCDTGLLSYEAKHFIHSSERRKFRCRHDYYWASMFEVEYLDHTLGRTKIALAEAPDEALPEECRPTFGIAWLLKDKFKLNSTYDCWYIPGFPKVKIYQDNFFRCQAKDHLLMKMLKQYGILLTRILSSWADKKTHAKYFSLGTIGGMVSGFTASLITFSLIRQMQRVFQKLSTARRSNTVAIYAGRLRRVCLFVAYFCLTCWLTLQYRKWLGLMEYFRIL